MVQFYVVKAQTLAATMHIASETGGHLTKYPNGTAVVLTDRPTSKTLQGWSVRYGELILVEAVHYVKVVSHVYDGRCRSETAGKLAIAEAASRYLTDQTVDALWKEREEA